MGRKLRDMEIEEISFVNKAATGRSFMIVKNAEVTNTMEELEKLINEFNPEGHEIAVLRKAKDKLPKDMLNELTKAYEAFVKYKDDLPSDLKEAIDVLGKYAVSGDSGGKGIKKSESWPTVATMLFGGKEEGSEED